MKPGALTAVTTSTVPPVGVVTAGKPPGGSTAQAPVARVLIFSSLIESPSSGFGGH
ncbi:hypothetical protein [Mesorhizobium sp.]|uniref:hypothetical protein n=1 Tax=Mesorhizobium sp. TaxID=1871066 RepID=UPI0025FE9790|nr:hypothetical protein [Mesorhizobium sp.]